MAPKEPKLVIIDKSDHPWGKVTWKLKSPNGKVLAESPQKYSSVRACKRALESAMEYMKDVEIEVVNEE